jgi:hypothetical protein
MGDCLAVYQTFTNAPATDCGETHRFRLSLVEEWNLQANDLFFACVEPQRAQKRLPVSARQQRTS